MSAREWKPGDVALYEYLASGRLVALRVKGGNSKSGGDCPNEMHSVEDHWHLSNGGWTLGTSESIHRRLVLIDPEDTDQIARLVRSLIEVTRDPGVKAYLPDLPYADVKAALREFANPVPKPPEPTGLGAVVEDADGLRWVRDVDDDLDRPWLCTSRTADHRRRFYSVIAAVRVLSEGVTA